MVSTDSEKSKLTDSERELHGQSSIKLKSFLNNICGKDGTRYLELGVYKASTLIAALYGNPKTEAVGIENFTFDFREPQKYMEEGWPNMKSHLYDVLQKYQIVDEIKISLGQVMLNLMLFL